MCDAWQNLSFSAWLISFSITPSRSTHMATNGSIFFVFKVHQYFITCIPHCLEPSILWQILKLFSYLGHLESCCYVCSVTGEVICEQSNRACWLVIVRQWSQKQGFHLSSDSGPPHKESTEGALHWGSSAEGAANLVHGYDVRLPRLGSGEKCTQHLPSASCMGGSVNAHRAIKEEQYWCHVNIEIKGPCLEFFQISAMEYLRPS